MRNFKYTSILSVLIAGVLFFGACSDSNSAGEPPSIPDLSEVRPEFDFFDQNAAKSVNGDGYQFAASLSQSMEVILTSFSSLPESFLGAANNEEPTFDDGIWTWEYTASGGGESVTIRLEAEETNTRVEWAMFISANTQEQSFDNYKLFDGFVLNDSNEGEWNIYPFEQNNSSQPVMTYDWVIESETVASFNFTFDSNNASSLSYDKDSPDNTLTVRGDGETTIIYWDSSTGTGYYDDGTERICWDADFNDVACTGA